MKKFLILGIVLLTLIGCMSYVEQPKTFRVVMLNENTCMITNNYRATNLEQLRYDIILKMASVTYYDKGYQYFVLLRSETWYEGGVSYVPQKQTFIVKNVVSNGWDKIQEGVDEGIKNYQRNQDIERATKKWFISCTILMTNEKSNNTYSASEILREYNLNN